MGLMAKMYVQNEYGSIHTYTNVVNVGTGVHTISSM